MRGDRRARHVPRPTASAHAPTTAALLLAAAILAGCGVPGDAGHPSAGDPRYQPARYLPADVPGGTPEQGERAIKQKYGCGACHVIPGVAGATGMVGPPLTNWAKRVYIAGSLPNTPDNLVLWIRQPQAIEPGTAMPDLGVSEEDARDIAAYLYTLR